MSKEADRYYYDAFPVTLNIGEETRYEYITNAFDAGVDSTNKRISDVNNYYKQLEGMSEEYQKGYIQAEKDMPKQFEAIHDIIRLQKRIDELEAKNKWHNINSEPIPTLSFHEKDDTLYLVKLINSGGIRLVTGTEISVDMAGGCFYQYWKEVE